MTDLHRFTPPALAALDPAPVFLLMQGDHRARRNFRGALIVEGLSTYSPDLVREEARRGLRVLWEPESADKHLGRVEAYWQAVDAFNAAQERGEEVSFTVDDAERAAVEDLLSRLGENWEPLRRMGAANATYAAEAPSLVLSVLLRGWEHVKLAYSRESGTVSLDKLEVLENLLGEMERANGGTAGLAYMELCGAALERLFPPASRPAPADTSTPLPAAEAV